MTAVATDQMDGTSGFCGIGVCGRVSGASQKKGVLVSETSCSQASSNKHVLAVVCPVLAFLLLRDTDISLNYEMPACVSVSV